MSERIKGYKCPICGCKELYFEEVVDKDCYYEQSCIFCNGCKAMITSEKVDGTTDQDKELLLKLINKGKLE